VKTMSKATGNNKDMDDLIAKLAGQLEPVKRFPHPLKLALIWLGIVAIYMGFVIAILGVRADIATQLQSSEYLFEIALSLSLSLSAGFAVLWLCIPDMRGQKWMIMPPIVLLLALMVWIALRTTFDTFHIPQNFWNHCSSESLLFAVVPSISIFLLSWKGKTTHHWLLPFMTALAVGGMGYAGLRATCLSEDLGHILMYHTAPYFIFAFLATLLGQRLYRW